MKRRIKLIGIVMAFIFTFGFSGYGQTVNQPSLLGGKIERVYHPKEHKAPSRLFIEYRYNGNGFSFLPSVLFKFLEVTVIGVETGEVWGAVVSEASGYTMETGSLPAGTYNISAFTEAGDEYYGEFVMPE